MSLEERVLAGCAGAALAFLLSFLGQRWTDHRKEKIKKKNILRIIHADIKATIAQLDSIQAISSSIADAREDKPHPLFIFNPSRMGNFFLDFKEEIYLIPPNLAEPILIYYDLIEDCVLYCNTFKSPEFVALEFERRIKGYRRWVTKLTKAREKGISLKLLLELYL